MFSKDIPQAPSLNDNIKGQKKNIFIKVFKGDSKTTYRILKKTNL